jgi:hypothetical protein
MECTHTRAAGPVARYVLKQPSGAQPFLAGLQTFTEFFVNATLMNMILAHLCIDLNALSKYYSEAG